MTVNDRLQHARLDEIRSTLTTYATRLRLARALANLGREQLAARAGISVESIAVLERGGRHPFSREARALADALGVSIEFFRATGVSSEALARVFSGQTDANARALGPGEGA